MAYETEDHEIQYCFPAVNSSCIKRNRSIHEYNIMYAFFSLLSLWTVFLNLLVIISISHFKKLHTPTNLLILSLAVSDLLVGLIVMPVEAMKLIETCWYLGDTFCGLFILILCLVILTSLCNLVLIAVDRYIAVCYPLLYPQKITTGKALIAICICWVFCSAYNISYVVSTGYFGVSYRSNVCYGECLVTISFAWRATDMFFSFLFPCTLIITLYLRIFYVAHQQVKVINTMIKRVKCITESSARRKSESKAALTLGIVVAIFLLCWIPYHILSLTKNTAILSIILKFLSWGAYVNSGLNPLVYALFYSWFKLSVKHILTLKVFRPASSLLDLYPDCS